MTERERTGFLKCFKPISGYNMASDWKIGRHVWYRYFVVSAKIIVLDAVHVSDVEALPFLVRKDIYDPTSAKSYSSFIIQRFSSKDGLLNQYPDTAGLRPLQPR